MRGRAGLVAAALAAAWVTAAARGGERLGSCSLLPSS